MLLLVLGAESTGPVVGGAFGLLVAFAAALLREINRNSGGAWRVVREKNRELHHKDWELERKDWQIAYWRFQADAGPKPGPEPGPYVPPTDQELKAW